MSVWLSPTRSRRTSSSRFGSSDGEDQRSGGRVRDRIEHDRDLAVPSGRIADREPVDVRGVLAAFGRPDRDEPVSRRAGSKPPGRASAPRGDGDDLDRSLHEIHAVARVGAQEPLRELRLVRVDRVLGLGVPGSEDDDVALGSAVVAQAHARADAHLARVDLRRVENTRSRELVGDASRCAPRGTRASAARRGTRSSRAGRRAPWPSSWPRRWREARPASGATSSWRCASIALGRRIEVLARRRAQLRELHQQGLPHGRAPVLLEARDAVESVEQVAGLFLRARRRARARPRGRRARRAPSCARAGSRTRPCAARRSGPGRARSTPPGLRRASARRATRRPAGRCAASGGSCGVSSAARSPSAAKSSVRTRASSSREICSMKISAQSAREARTASRAFSRAP